MKVSVGEFRDAISNLLDTFRRDYSACVTPKELNNWRRIAAPDLIAFKALTCARASERDMVQYKYALELAEKTMEGYVDRLQ